jgi:NAD(P)H-dependent flavin oxidoreductase YrpB (nitropropane dioxygenase family)
LESLKRPYFLAIVSSATLAMNLAKKATGFVDGFVIENKTAGGHNAPPRGPLHLNEKGEPIYGPKDDADLKVMREIGRPFWLAGSYATPNLLRDAIADGAVGVQVGTAFAFSSESGLDPATRNSVIRSIGEGLAPGVFTDPVASPSGFPFKVARVSGTISEADAYAARPRKCDLGYLRSPHLKPDGHVGYRCQSEPIDTYLKKGGKIEDTVGRKCLCNGLMSVIGHSQLQKGGYVEAPIITAGDDLMHLGRLTKGEPYSAKFVIDYLRLGVPASYQPSEASSPIASQPEASA